MLTSSKLCEKFVKNIKCMRLHNMIKYEHTSIKCQDNRLITFLHNMSKSKPPVQLDVAKRAGVSSATVSRVLNKSGLVRSEIKRRVE